MRESILSCFLRCLLWSADVALEVEVARALAAVDVPTVAVPKKAPALPTEAERVRAMIASAIAAKLPLVVWLNHADAPLRANSQLTDCLHVEATVWQGQRGPGVIVMRPDGSWLLWDSVLPAADVRAATIRQRFQSPTQAASPDQPWRDDTGPDDDLPEITRQGWSILRASARRAVPSNC